MIQRVNLEPAIHNKSSVTLYKCLEANNHFNSFSIHFLQGNTVVTGKMSASLLSVSVSMTLYGVKASKWPTDMKKFV